MKVIITELQKSILSEDMGVAVPSVPYINLIYQKLEERVISFLNGKEKKINDLIVLGLSEISEIYKNNPEDFIDFPIEEIQINFSAERLRNDRLSVSFTSSGAAYQINHKKENMSFLKKPSLSIPKKILKELKSTVVAKFDFSIYINKEYNESMEDELLYDFRDTIMHELNHLYEFYNRTLKDDKNLVDVTLSYAGGKNYNVPRDIFSVWENFLYFVYFSEPYEMRAMTQEAYSKRIRMSFDEFKNTKYWKYSKMMEEFDANKLFDRLIEKIEEHNPEYLIPIMSRLYLWFLRDYYRGTKEMGKEPKKLIQNSKHLLDLMMRFQPRIRLAGKKLQRNFMRLYSLSPEDN